MATAEQRLAIQLLATAMSDAGESNALTSPYGVLELLAVLEAGTSGKTGAGLKEAIGLDADASHADVAEAVAEIRRLGFPTAYELGAVVEAYAPYGLRITQVEAGGPADQAGLKIGDLLFTADGEPLRTPDQLQDLLTDAPGNSLLSGFSVTAGREFPRKQVALRRGYLESTPERERPVTVASVVCLDRTLAEKSPFPGLVSRLYPAQSFPANFEASDRLLASVRQYLTGTLGKDAGDRFALPETFPADTRLWAANAIGMDVLWREPLRIDRSEKRARFLTPTGERSVPLLHGSLTTCQYAEFADQGIRILELGYERSSLVLQIVLPTTPRGWRELPPSAWLSPEAGRKFRNLRQRKPVDFLVPQFSISRSMSVTSALNKGPLASLFSSQADFRGISTEPLRLSACRQQVFLQIDELGTRAGALTEAELVAASASAPPIPFHVLHPFFFAVRDAETGVVFFAGRVTDPSAE